MGRIIIYPYDAYSAPFLRHRSLIPNEEIVGVVSPKGWVLHGKDAGNADGGDDTGIIVSCEFDDNLNLCDTVWFTQSETMLDFKTYIYPKIELALNKGKNIINTIPIQDEEVLEIQKKCSQNNVIFRNYIIPKQQRDSEAVFVENEYIFGIDKPIVYVLGLSERTDKFEIQLSLREIFQNIGYKVGQIGSRNCCEIMGFHSFPNYMLGNTISESNKVVLFNHYIKSIECKENPDVIIIGIPGGIMPFNKNITNRFGILAYEVFQAASPDAAVLSTCYETYDPESIEKLMTSLRYKLGIDVNCLNMSNKKLNLHESESDINLHFTTFEHTLVESKKEELNHKGLDLYNIFNEEDRHKMSEKIIDVLSRYSILESV